MGSGMGEHRSFRSKPQTSHDNQLQTVGGLTYLEYNIRSKRHNETVQSRICFRKSSEIWLNSQSIAKRKRSRIADLKEHNQGKKDA